MIQILNRWLSRNKKNMESRLCKEDVLTIARKAAAEYPNCEDLNIVTLEENSGASIWIITSTAVGRTLQVSIDDASSKVIEIKQIGIR